MLNHLEHPDTIAPAAVQQIVDLDPGPATIGRDLSCLDIRLGQDPQQVQHDAERRQRRGGR